MLVQFLEQQVAVIPLEGQKFLHGRKLVMLIVKTGLDAHQIHAMGVAFLLHTLVIKKDFDDGVFLGQVQGYLRGGDGRLGVFSLGPSTIGDALDVPFVVPHVHRGPAIVARLIAADVTEKGLEAMEGSSAVPQHRNWAHTLSKVRGWTLCTDGVQFEASKAKKMAMTMGALLRGGVSGWAGGKVRAIWLVATIAFEPGTPMVLKVPGLVPFVML